nr:SpoVR family protein [Ktedonobacterales bacterium]
VLGHTDMFKHNVYFKHTPPNMIDKVSVNADRIRQYEYDHGSLEVERFLDAVLAIQEHIDSNFRIKPDPLEDGEQLARERNGPRESHYADLWSLDTHGQDEHDDDEPPRAKPRHFPAKPVKDLLLFLAEHAPSLEEWQRDILLIVREEEQYFIPQMQTKVINEGWASFTHARIMRELDLTNAEYTAFAQMHAGVLAPNRFHINPYHVGYHILEDIERRWDNPTQEEREKLGRQPGQGRAKLFEVREMESDVSLLRNYLTKDLVRELDLYLYRKEGDEWVVVEKDWEKVRDGLISSLTNFGMPYITIDDADFNRNTELLLRHHFEGQELDLPYAEKTLEYVHYIWSRPVHLETTFEGHTLRFSYNGEKHSRTVLDRGER